MGSRRERVAGFVLGALEPRIERLEQIDEPLVLLGELGEALEALQGLGARGLFAERPSDRAPQRFAFANASMNSTSFATSAGLTAL